MEPSRPAFCHTVTVRFNEVDRAGIAFFGRVFEWCHEAYEELFAAAGFPVQRIFEREDWAMPLVHAEADYRRPMRLGEQLRIEVRIERLGAHSMTFGYTIHGADGSLRASAKLVHAFVELAQFRRRAVPEELCRALAALGLLPAEG
ncbi:MAG: 1,4-dihydroxy-2-naphthoyl-CoA hydrolase [Planctomycetota bacterium]|nr:MAG: 1,4-dihydroxy-2-naphthoyl-CoA hydrolase [Planctomycetota bacterium]